MPIHGTRTLGSLIAAAGLFALPAAQAMHGRDVLERFDSQIAAGLPATIALSNEGPARTRARREVGNGRLVIDEKVEVGVNFPGSISADTYRGTLDDQPVVVTRSGHHLDVARPHAQGIAITGYTDDSDVVEDITIADFAPDVPPPAITADATPAPAPARLPRALAQTAPSRERKLDIRMFVHDDLLRYMTREHVHAAFVSWWLADLRASVAPFVQVDVYYYPPVVGVTDVPYRHTKALVDWTSLMTRWAQDEDIDDTHLNKFVLVTPMEPQPGISGVAWQGGNVAIASASGRYRILAHELGHLLGAEHTDGEVRFQGGWWCETNMYAYASSFRSNCYGYTPANARRMRAYIVEGPEISGGKHAVPPVLN